MHARANSGMGVQPVLLPDQHSPQGCGDPVELSRTERAPRVGQAHHRPRRHAGRRGWDRSVDPARHRHRARPQRDHVTETCASGRCLRRRRLRQLCAHPAMAGGGVLVADRAFRARRSTRTALRDGRNTTRGSRPAGCSTSKAGCRRRDATSSTGSRSRWSISARARSRSERSKYCSSSSTCCGRCSMRCRPPMDLPENDVLLETPRCLDDVLEISRHFRLQFEPAQSAWVLLYPEGMVKLTGSAGEIMKRMRWRDERRGDRFATSRRHFRASRSGRTCSTSSTSRVNGAGSMAVDNGRPGTARVGSSPS